MTKYSLYAKIVLLFRIIKLCCYIDTRKPIGLMYRCRKDFGYIEGIPISINYSNFRWFLEFKRSHRRPEAYFHIPDIRIID